MNKTCDCVLYNPSGFNALDAERQTEAIESTKCVYAKYSMHTDFRIAFFSF